MFACLVDHTLWSCIVSKQFNEGFAKRQVLMSLTVPLHHTLLCLHVFGHGTPQTSTYVEAYCTALQTATPATVRFVNHDTLPTLDLYLTPL